MFPPDRSLRTSLPLDSWPRIISARLCCRSSGTQAPSSATGADPTEVDSRQIPKSNTGQDGELDMLLHCSHAAGRVYGFAILPRLVANLILSTEIWADVYSLYHRTGSQTTRDNDDSRQQNVTARGTEPQVMSSGAKMKDISLMVLCNFVVLP